MKMWYSKAMTTGERLRQFYEFDDAVIEAVERAAYDQNQQDFHALAGRYAVADGPQVIAGTDYHKPFQLLSIRPEGDYDDSRARVLHAPMSIPVDASLAMRALRLFGADPSQPLLVVGNPAAIGNRYGKLSLHDMRRVAGGDLTPAVDPLLAYLQVRRIDATEQIGYSYGAEKAATTARRANEGSYGIRVDRAVLMEPVSVVKRSLLALGRSFQRSGAHLDAAVEAASSEPLAQARQEADSGLTRYIGGLLRLSNLAIIKSLATDKFETRVEQALNYQPTLRAAIVWGSRSELASPADLGAIVARLGRRFGQEKVAGLEMAGMYHAGGDDIDLHAAMVLQGLRA